MTPPDPKAAHLALPTSPTPRTYRIETDTELYVGDLTYLNKSEARLQLSRPAPQQATLKGLSFRQTNLDGEHRIDPEMARLRHNLDLRLQPDGRIETIVNQPERLTALRALRADWLQRFPRNTDFTPPFFDSVETLFADPDHLTRSLSQSPELELLLPGLYNRSYKVGEAVAGPDAVLTPLTGTLAMPLKTTVTRRPPQSPDVALDLLLTGTLDKARFPFKEARRLLQDLTRVVDIDPMPAIQYMLTFEFDRQHNLLYAGRFVTCIYENLAMSKIVTLLGPDQPVTPSTNR